jgi:hypothetical protein
MLQIADVLVGQSRDGEVGHDVSLIEDIALMDVDVSTMAFTLMDVNE